MSRRASALALVVVVAAGAAACAPRLKPATGAVSFARFPSTALPRGLRQVVFQWTLIDRDFEARGDGAARLASPDSARVDFFLAGGGGSGAAVLIGSELRLGAAAGTMAARLVPPAPLLWAALGRAATPSLRDTVLRVDGDTLRADIGTPVAWRLTWARDTLRRLERVRGGRIVESVARLADGRVRYRNEEGRRRLDLTITRSTNVSRFDAAIWNLP